MKIAFVVSQFPLLSESFIVQQITGLIHNGHDIKIMAFGKSEQTVVQKEILEYDLIRKTTYLRWPKNKFYLRIKGVCCLIAGFLSSPPVTIKLLKHFRKEGSFSYPNLFLNYYFLKEQFDIIHAHFGPNGIRSLCGKTSGAIAHLVTTFHGYDVTVFIREHGNGVYQQLFELGDIFTYNSEATKKKLITLGCPENKMKKLPMGVNIKNIPFKERYYNAPETIRLLSVGRLVEMKGREYAIRAIARLNTRHSIRYDIIGDGPLRQNLQDLITELNLDDVIKLWGWCSSEQLNQFYEAAHIFIHPSITASDGNQEGQGVVLLEAQAYGIPVVATQHGAFPDSMIDGKTGFLVPEKDSKELAEKIEHLIVNSHLWPQIGRQGRNFVETKFDAVTLSKKLQDIYENVLSI